MKFFITLMIVTTSLNVFSAQNAAKDLNCCQTCQTAEAVACRGSFGQKRLKIDKSPASVPTNKSQNNKARATKGTGA